jgi:hypothetical protein
MRDREALELIKAFIEASNIFLFIFSSAKIQKPAAHEHKVKIFIGIQKLSSRDPVP